MIEVTVDSIRVSLMSHHRVVILKALEDEQYLPIWIGPFEADAITAELQGTEVARPLTHDILKTVIQELGGEIIQVVITELRNDTFYARVMINHNGKDVELDSRPSDALALAVRARVPVFVTEKVMEVAGVVPEGEDETEVAPLTDDGSISAFADFLESLDMEDLEDEDDEKKP